MWIQVDFIFHCMRTVVVFAMAQFSCQRAICATVCVFVFVYAQWKFRAIFITGTTIEHPVKCLTSCTQLFEKLKNKGKQRTKIKRCEN